MEQVAQLVVFVLAQQRFGVWLRHVECVLAAAQTTPVPGAPPLVLGIIDLHGTMVPILDLRPRWLSSVPVVQVADQFIIVKSGPRRLGLLANQTVGLAECPSTAPGALGLLGRAGERFEGAVTLEDGLVLIHDVERFMRASEALALDTAMAGMPGTEAHGDAALRATLA